MSTHPSLKSGKGTRKHQSVLKRLERLLHLIKKDEWKEGNSIFALPKVKVLKFKIKKEKAEKAEEEAALAEGAVPAESAEAKTGAPAKEGEKAQKPSLKDKQQEKK